MNFSFRSAAVVAGVSLLTLAGALAWSLEEATLPYAGTEISVILPDRPAFRAIAAMLPGFEKRTGIKVKSETVPYENTLERQTRDFSSNGGLSLAVVDLVWLGNFAGSDYIVPVDELKQKYPAIFDPDYGFQDFFPLLLDAVGSWNGKLYGPPFDNRSGLLYYNMEMLREVGFDQPPATWEDLLKVYAPKLTAQDRYAYALQSRLGDTQACDGFLRFIWPWGGSLLDAQFRSNLMSPQSQAGLQFRQNLIRYMPPGVVDFDHNEVLNAFARGQVAMVTEWSDFYPVLADPKGSKVSGRLGIAPEPKGPDGRKPVLGGFSLAVARQGNDKQQAAAWLFIQWATSKETAKEYVEKGGMSGRQSIIKDPELIQKYPIFPALAESWQQGVPEFRPRFAEWPQISEIISDVGTRMMTGNTSVEQGCEEISKRMEDVLAKAGYYDGKKKPIQ